MPSWMMRLGMGLACAGALFSVSCKVQAFQVEPAITDLSLTTGSSTTREIQVRNTDPYEQSFFLTVQKFAPGGNGQPRFLDPNDTEGLPSWIRVTDPQFTLQPGEQKMVRVTIDVPKEALSGGTYAAVFITEKPQQTAPVGIAKRIASLFLVAVNQKEAPANIRFKRAEQSYGAIGDWRRWFVPRGAGKVTAEIENKGRSHGMGIVEVRQTIWGWKGKREQSFSQVVRLLPQETRTIVFDWEDRSPFYSVQTEVYVNGMRQTSLSKISGILPSGWMIITLVFLGFVIAGGAIRRSRRRSN